LLAIPFFFVFVMGFNRTTKNVIWGSVVSYNSSKFLHDAVILKNREKDRELVFSAMARHFLESKKGLLFLLVIRSKVNADCEEKLSIWGSPDIKKDVNM
jgi:hypothetical protein